MALLTQNPAQGLQGQDASSPPQDPAAMQQDPASPEQSQGLSFTAEQLADSFKQNMNDKQTENMGEIIDEGKELLFGPDTHSKLMGMLEGSQNIGQDLGKGAVGAMDMVLQSVAKEKPGEEINGEAVIPAGMVLIALALEFVNESGMAPVTDDDYEEATHIFTTKMSDTYNPEFKARREQFQGQDAVAQNPAAQVQSPVGQAAQPAGGM